MARTLADMAPEEQQACVGMWANIGGELGVIRGIEAGMVSWIDTRHPNRSGYATVGAVTPRFDLPRAWNPDGTPVALAEEADYRIVNTDTNGGKYELRRWVRGVTEWRLNDE